MTATALAAPPTVVGRGDGGGRRLGRVGSVLGGGVAGDGDRRRPGRWCDDGDGVGGEGEGDGDGAGWGGADGVVAGVPSHYPLTTSHEPTLFGKTKVIQATARLEEQSVHIIRYVAKV
jgi:hypothetical protein